MTAPYPSRLELIALARLYTTAKTPPGPAEVRSALSSLAGAGRTDADAAFERLATRGDITRSPLRLTDAGRARIREELGLSEPQPWRRLKATLFPALALGLDPRDRKVARRLGRADELRKLVTTLATRARRSDVDAVRTALARRWLAGEPGLGGARAGDDARRSSSAAGARTEAAAPPGDGASASGGEELSLERFAEVARTHAASVGNDGRFGERKVFIAAAWERARSDPRLASLDVDQFKRRLVESHRRGLLTLHRADLVPAMDPGKVQASEARYMNATFHFVEPEAPRKA